MTAIRYADFWSRPTVLDSRPSDIHGKWSLRASVTSGLSLQDVRIPESNLLPGSGGLKSPLMCLNQARYGIAWGAIGAAMACYDCALQYSLLRKQFRDQPIASHQLVQEKLAWMISEITKAQLLVLQVGRLKDAGKVQHQHISMAKRNNVWMALECARLSRDILGANGVADDYPIMRHLMNLESVKTYEGTHDIHTLIIGASVTGIDAFWVRHTRRGRGRPRPHEPATRTCHSSPHFHLCSEGDIFLGRILCRRQ